MKEKAKELVDKMDEYIYTSHGHCADENAQKNCSLECALRERRLLLNMASRSEFGTPLSKYVLHHIEKNELLIHEINKL